EWAHELVRPAHINDGDRVSAVEARCQLADLGPAHRFFALEAAPQPRHKGDPCEQGKAHQAIADGCVIFRESFAAGIAEPSVGQRARRHDLRWQRCGERRRTMKFQTARTLRLSSSTLPLLRCCRTTRMSAYGILLNSAGTGRPWRRLSWRGGIKAIG